MVAKRMKAGLALLGVMVLGLAVPASALPVEPRGLVVSAAEPVQFNTRGNMGNVPRGPGGMRDPGRRGGVIIGPGLFLPPVIDALSPRGRRVIVEEYEDDDEPVRPRRRAKRVPERAPVARDGGRRAPPPRQARPAAPRLPPVSIPRASERRYVADEILFELRPGIQPEVVLRRHRLTQLASTRFELANANIIRARVDGGRNARQVLQQMAGDARIAGAQPNYLFTLQQEPEKKEASAETPKAAVLEAPAVPPPQPKPQYVLDRMALADAHRLAQGARVKIALIDTGLDDSHPELAGAIAARFDALGTDPAGTLDHATALAGAIAGRASLRGVSPGADVLAARVFGGPQGAPAQGTSFQILQALDWAAMQGARVLNLSFAGPQDRLMGRSLEGARGRKIVAVAAVGNAGPGTAPLYPAAEPSVLAVTATDATDAIFNRANTGAQVAIAAPGVDVIAAAPEQRYTFTSGTSVAAAHVSGLVALLLERNPDLDLAGVKRLLAATALDLGPRGADAVFGAGRVNAAAAVQRAVEEVGRK